MKARVIGIELDEQSQLKYVKVRFDSARPFHDIVSISRDWLPDSELKLGDTLEFAVTKVWHE